MEIIPFDKREGEIWYNGEFVNWPDAKVHVLNHGLHYASCVFEGCRAYGGKIFKLTEHSQRLHKSAEILGFKIPYSVEELDAACNEAVKRNNFKNGYIRPVAWRGSEMMAISAQKTSINVAIAAWEWAKYFTPEMHERGLHLQTAKWRRPAPDSAPTASKAAGLYMICTMSKHAAEAEGFDDALMLDYRGYVAESTGANIFFVIGNELHTPTPDCFLNGITRRTVMELAMKRGMKVIERFIKPEDMGEASEVFLTGSAAEVTPVGKIDALEFKSREVVTQLSEDYSKLVNS